MIQLDGNLMIDSLLWIQLLRSERAAWSNLTGSEPLPSKDEMPPPPSYEWDEDSNWELDVTGPWTDEQLGIGKNKVFYFSRVRILRFSWLTYCIVVCADRLSRFTYSCV